MEQASIAAGPLEASVRPAVWVEPGHLKGQQECAARAGYGMVVITNTAEAADKVPLYAIPDGWVLVPKQPTTDMLYAMAECDGYQRGDRDHPTLARWEDYWHMAMSALPPNAQLQPRGGRSEAEAGTSAGS